MVARMSGMGIEVQIDRMTCEEKLELVDKLWLSMKSDLDLLSVSTAEQKLLNDRWEAFVTDPDSAITVEEFQQRMRAARP